MQTKLSDTMFLYVPCNLTEGGSMCSFPGLWLHCLKQKRRVCGQTWSCHQRSSKWCVWHTNLCRSLEGGRWRREDIFLGRGETPRLKPWLNIVAWALLVIVPASGRRAAGLLKINILRWEDTCFVLPVSLLQGKLTQEGSKICQCLAEKGSQPYMFCCGLLELHAFLMLLQL